MSSPSASNPAGRARVVRPRRRCDRGLAALADVDYRLLAVLCEHRVVRQDQLQRLFPEVPPRTLRYRTRHLHDLGLLGRSRPYRERGSAPNHHWPTRRADCFTNGQSMPRGGERQQPNPLFLAHAAALSELYVALTVEAPAIGLRLFDYRREALAREPFEVHGKQRALAPDATVILVDADDRQLGAFVELDLGTMSHARLRQKADLYAAYVAADAWRERHLFLPALLFLTTTDARARRFLASVQSALAQSRRRYSPHALVAGAGDVALTPARLLTEPCLLDLGGGEPLTLWQVLEQAREPYEQIQRTNQKRREATDRKRAALHADPETARAALRRFLDSPKCYVEALTSPGRQAVEILAASDMDPSGQEMAALKALVGDLEATLVQPGFDHSGLPSAEAEQALAALVDHYRERQEQLVQRLAATHREGPSLRQARGLLDTGELLDGFALRFLAGKAGKDEQARASQQQACVAYLRRREEAARMMVRRSGPLGRLTRRPEEFYSQLDQRYLRDCEACGEIAYPTAFDRGQEEIACHFCRSEERLKPYRPTEPQLDQEEEWI